MDYFKEYCMENNILIMNFTETWLNESVQEDAEINGYQTFRRDRNGRRGGGTAIYVKEQVEAKQISEASIERCEMIAIYIEKINTINIVIYRPPDTKLSAFNCILDKINNILSTMSTPEPTVIITGDFNFPFVTWTKGIYNGCRWKITPGSRMTIDEKLQFTKLNEIADNYNLIQVIDEPTREKNTLDLVFTNDLSMITHIDVTKSCLSDHHLIELYTNFHLDNSRYHTDNKSYRGEPAFWHLNYHHEDISWSNINEEICKIPWQSLFNGKNTEICTDILIECLLMICLKLIPEKSKKNKRKIPRERKKLLNRLKMLKREKHRAHCKFKEKVFEKRIQETEEMLINHRKLERI